ncbi:50S ribosomal protein L4 [Anaerosporomusa subterranea]|uniref:Large ribosomal subunit protein uL4 n=1 Tax=Anaerosporomusa subterranea TaxID=1794912 RepID=A0A154BUV0_ANASB|nr:50S ribosomal protein L4 [Anaerosporomusa subterranea]KYZ77702.1 50S ribosomal protein L4 [Anaerosporomusa subterranea]
MAKVAVYNIAGQQTGEIELNDTVFGIEVNEAVVHQALVMQLASQRQGNAATKTRAMVRGGGRKPWKQKGTGRARAGTIRSPLWVGGGTVFGPHPRSYSFRMPRKARRLAIKSALSAKVQSGELVVLEGIQYDQPKTKQVVELLKTFGLEERKALLITREADENVEKSSRNIPGVKALAASGLNVFDLLHHDKLLITRDAVARIEEVLA